MPVYRKKYKKKFVKKPYKKTNFRRKFNYKKKYVKRGTIVKPNAYSNVLYVKQPYTLQRYEHGTSSDHIPSYYVLRMNCLYDPDVTNTG